MTVLSFDLDSYTNKGYGTHNFHPYPAKYVPQIPKELISRYSAPGDWILDPFCGSGTTLVEALSMKRHSVGTDVNPLACLISEVKTTRLNEVDIQNIRNALKRIEEKFRNRAEPQTPPPSIANIGKWFAPHIQYEVSLIRDGILEAETVAARNFLFVALSSILIKVSFQESDTRYRAVLKDLPDGISMSLFSGKVLTMLERHAEIDVIDPAIKCQVINTDATAPVILPHKIDLVVTSPPYLNSYDYYLYHKHRMAWLGFDHYIVQEKEFGSRYKHNDKGLGAEVYEQAIASHIENLKRFLSNGSKYACVVGDGVVRATLHKADEMFDRIFACSGFEKIAQFSYDQRKYTRAFTPNLQTQQKETHVLVYQYEGN